LNKEVKEMVRRNWLAGFLVILVLLFASSPACATRRSPGAQSKDVSVDAVFEDRAEVRHVWTHVQVRTPEGESAELETRLGDTIIRLQLTKITKVSLIDEKATPDGYAKATIVFPDGSEEVYELHVEEKGNPIALVGDTKGGKGEIALLRCKYIQFSGTTPGAAARTNEHPPAKK
jgi:hypothetical protein